MEFALEWREQPITEWQDAAGTPRRRVAVETPVPFLDYVIDGMSLHEQLGAEKIGPLGFLLPEAEEETARRLLLEEEPDVDDRVAVYVCPLDADLLCGAITAVIERVGDEIVWRDLAMSSATWPDQYLEWDHD